MRRYPQYFRSLACARKYGSAAKTTSGLSRRLSKGRVSMRMSPKLAHASEAM